MVRKAITLLSPVAALAIVWVSVQSFGVRSTETEPPISVMPQTTVQPAPKLLPELPSVSRILTTESTNTLGESVPESIKRILIANGAVLLVPEATGGGL